MWYEALSKLEVFGLVIVALMVIGAVTLYVTYRVIKAQIIRRIRIAKRITTYAASRVADKTKDSALAKKSGEVIRGVVGDEAVDRVSEALMPDDDENITKDLHGLLEEIAEESYLFMLIAFLFGRRFKKLIEKEEVADAKKPSESD